MQWTQFNGTPRDIAKKLLQEHIKPVQHDGYGWTYQTGDTFPFEIDLSGNAKCAFLAKHVVKDNSISIDELLKNIAAELDKLKVLMPFS